MIVLDASVLIAHLDGSDRHHARARRLLEKHAGEPFGASPITLAETLVAPARAHRLADAEAALRRLGVRELVLGDETAGRLASLRVETGLKMPDCCVLLAAERFSGAVASFDSALAKAAGSLGLPVAG